MKELVKEKRILEEKKDEEKLMNAIHRQAKDRFYFEKGKTYLKKNTKKEWKQNLINDLVCFTLGIVALVPTLLLLVILCK